MSDILQDRKEVQREIAKKEAAKPQEPAVYLSKAKNLKVRFRCARKIFISGEVVRQPGLRAEFANNKLVTYDPELIAELDKRLTGAPGRKWGRLYCKQPNSSQRADIKRTVEKLDKAKKEIMSKSVAAVEGEKFDDFLQNINQGGTRVVQGQTGSAVYGA